MKILRSFTGLALTAVISAQQPAPSATASAPPASTTPAAIILTPEEIVAEREKYVQEVLAAIKGREKEPAETVFQNIRSFKGVPAGRLVAVMNQGYARSLGVSCTHCHDPTDWAGDEKRTKLIAREMREMTAKLNGELLPAIKNLESKQPLVNCTTCHRGEVKPALNLPGHSPRPPATPAPKPAGT